PVFAVSIASVIGFLRESFILFAGNITHRRRRLNPRNQAHSGYVAGDCTADWPGLGPLLFVTRQRFDARGPLLRRPTPVLQLGRELIPLVEGADTDRMDLRVRVSAGRVDGRTAIGAKRLRPLVSTLSGLDIDLEFTLQEPEAAFFRRHYGAERRTGQGLTVGAVADRNRIRINFSFVADGATMATAVDLHRFVLLQLLTDPPSTTSDWPVTKSLSLEARNRTAPRRSSGYA